MEKSPRRSFLIGLTVKHFTPEELQPVGRTHVGEVCGGLSPKGEILFLEQKSMRSLSPEEEGAANIVYDAPSFLIVLSPGGKKVGTFVSEVTSGKRGVERF